MSNQFTQYPVGEEIIRALDLLGFSEPTAVQRAVIPLALAGRDVLAQAQTGSGKTAAFAIPLCQLIDWEENRPQGLILAPTRELAIQIQEETALIGKFKRVKIPALIGKASFQQQVKDVKQKSHLVVGTPGRVLDHLERGTVDFSAVRFLVLDEADEMLNMGFVEQVDAILQALPAQRQTLLFSATMPKGVIRLAESYLSQPEQVVLAEEGITTDRIAHQYYDCTEWNKTELLQGVLMVHNPDSCIIFANTREDVDWVCDELLEREFTCDKLHGGMEQRDRTQVMADFKKGSFRYLVATDVAARGIDVAHVDIVVNYDLPKDRESYVHRIGRTGRAGEQGLAISLADAGEMKHLSNLERFIGLPIQPQEPPTVEAVKAARPAFLHKMRQLPQTKAGKSAAFSQAVVKLHIVGGKKDKLRPTDIVGTICAIDGVEAADIGVITILDWSSYVEILNGKGQLVVQALQTKPIKAQLRRVTVADR